MRKYLLPLSVGVIVLIGIAVFIDARVKQTNSSDGASLQMASGVVDAEVPDATVITLTENGYEPREVTVKAGDTITFRSTRGLIYWPASDLHPSHAIYSEFDPQEPIQADQSWSFVFTKVGMWEYHDHLFPYFTGVITVTE